MSKGQVTLTTPTETEPKGCPTRQGEPDEHRKPDECAADKNAGAANHDRGCHAGQSLDSTASRP